MTPDALFVPLERVPCNVCQHDIPASEALVAEATDYVIYFCGLDCYDRWRHRGQAIPQHSLAMNERKV
jgi:Domain of unknown function (DUF3330)